MDERREKEPGRRKMDANDHDEICDRRTKSLKNEMCLKAKNTDAKITSLNEALGRMWRVLVVLLVFLLSSGGIGIWVKYAAVQANEDLEITNTEQDGRLDHLKDDLTDLEDDVEDLKGALSEFRKEQNRANNELLQAIYNLGE